LQLEKGSHILSFLNRAEKMQNLAVMVIFTVALTSSMIYKARAQAGGQIITPTAKYTDPSWQQKASSYQGNLSRMQRDLQARFKPGQFQLLTTGESAVGGVGFWPIPVRFGEPSRYLAVFARVQVPPPTTGRAFPDTQTGRILTIMDAYGKETINMMAREIKAAPDPLLAGGALLFIYSKKPVGDPEFEQTAEALALFMNKDSLTKFAELRMTMQSLFSQSEMLPIFAGQDQIQNLRLYIIQA